jgi:hypothetical protein
MLSEPQLTRLREAIVTRLRDPSADDEDLRRVLHDVAAEARSRSLRPEELIISLKAVLAQVGSARFPSAPEEQRRLQEWLVTACIQAYFAKD